MRYVREVRFRFIGDAARAQSYRAIARSILGELYDTDITLGERSFAHRVFNLNDGTRIRVILDPTVLPVIEIDVRGVAGVVEPPPYTARLVWMPEGIVLTPTSTIAPDGYGLPHRDLETGAVLDNELGTLAGRLPQVMINKYQNNAYLDKGEFILAVGADGEVFSPKLGENLRLRDDPNDNFSSPSLQYQNWHPLYQPYDCGDDPEVNGVDYWAESRDDIPGLYLGTDVYVAQFQPRYANSFVYEPKSTEWFTHRPEEALYYYAGYEGSFQYTNTVRLGAGLEQIFRPLRGRADMSLISLTEVVLTGLQFHENEAFRPGFRNQTSRGSAARNLVAMAENLYIGPEAPGTFEEGEAVAEIWEASPYHYANMTSAVYDLEQYGCELHIASGGATITETWSLGELINPITGTEWVQNYGTAATWVPCPYQYHEGVPHVIGNYGKFNSNDRGGFSSSPGNFYVTWGQVTLAIPQDLFDEPAFSVLGAAFYTDADGEGRIRCVVACGDQGRNKPGHDDYADFDDFVLGVITTEIRSTGRSQITVDEVDYDVTGACRWEVEAAYEFTAADDWIPAPPGQVKFSPDGSKFVFTMSQIGTRYPGPRYLSTYLTPHEPVSGVKDNCDVKHWRVQYIEGRVVGTVLEPFEFTEIPMPSVNVFAGETRTVEDALSTSEYQRNVNGSFPALFDYDDLGTLIWATCKVTEQQFCAYPGTANFCRKTRKLIFPSGKEVVYLEEVLSEHTGTCEFKQFYYIDVRSEDCVFINRTTRTVRFVTQANLDGGAIPGETDESWIGDVGRYTIEVDMGRLSDRTQEVLWEQEGDTAWGGRDGVCSAIFNTSGNGPTEFDFSQPRMTYQAGTSPIVYLIGNYPTICPTSRPAITNTGVGEGVDYINSIHLQNHRVNWMAGIATRPVEVDGDSDIYELYGSGSTAYWGTRLVLDELNVSLRQSSVAPAMVPDPNIAKCQVARYDERVVVRIENTRLPWRNLDVTYNGTYNGYPVISNVNFNWHEVPEAAAVLLWANFDIDEATGIEDVTDIQPFGRVG